MGGCGQAAQPDVPDRPGVAAQKGLPAPAAEAGPAEVASPSAPSGAEAVRAGRRHRVGAGLLIMAVLTAVAVVAVGTLHQPAGRLTSASTPATANGPGAAGSGGTSAGAGGPLSLRAAGASSASAGRSDPSLRLILPRDGQSAGHGAAGPGPAGAGPGLPAPGRGTGPGGSGQNPGAPAPAAPAAPVQHKSAPPRPAPATITATGHVTCLSGAAVEGVWVVGRNGGSGWATWQASAQTASYASFSRQVSRGDWEVHVGCGGSPATWKVATYSGWVSATASFTCDDIAGQGQYGQCSA
jgi:hypothetical protein